jgi:nicotinate-nucleotide--dimethylbenzimidazole phosphoribosyltransferase
MLAAPQGPSAAAGLRGASDFDAAVRWGEGLAGASGLEQLAALGGPDTAVLSGLLLGAASMNVPILLDGYATGAAALVAYALAPAVTGYLIAAHAGTWSGGSHASGGSDTSDVSDASSLQRRILAHLGLAPMFDVGLGQGEGIGAAMVLPLVDQVAALGSSGYNPLDG